MGTTAKKKRPASKKTASKKTAKATTRVAKTRGLTETARALKDAATAKRVKRAKSLLALIARRKARIVEDFYDMGEALRTLSREKLYEALGYPSFQALLIERDVIAPTTAKKLIAVVEAIPREQALSLGQEKSYALVAYAAATPESDSAAQLSEIDARVGKKKVSSSSVRDLTDAAGEARRKKPRTKEARAADADRARAIAAVKKRVTAWKVGKIAVEGRADAIVITLSVAQALELGS